VPSTSPLGLRRGGDARVLQPRAFHKHEDEQIVVHLLVELYARSAEEATRVLEEAAGGELAIASLAEESRPPAAGAGESPHS
jgi:hypothetical protein